jgi:DMSO/TMAO reductase YedYZ molybdopterin-dependent catalytic subunit
VIITLSLIALAWSLNIFDLRSPETPNPTINQRWLVVDGLVQNPLNLTSEELVALPRTTVDTTLYCVDFPNSPLASGNWTGVRLSLILDIASVSSGATKVAFRAADGFSTDLTVGTAMRQDVILAYERDGQLLPENLRLVVPGKWGYKWISNLNHIELVDYDFKGFWESRGYSDDAEIPLGP